MVVRKNIEIKGKQFMHNYSDLGFYIERGGIEYEEAIDPIPEAYERYYKETDKKIGEDEDEISD